MTPHDSDPGIKPPEMDSGTFFKVLERAVEHMKIADIAAQPRKMPLSHYMRRLTRCFENAQEELSRG